MNQSSELNSELLSADARGRKHIPVAVFAVIAIHILLFVVLLIAAGCRSSARAKANQPAPEPARLTHPAEKYMQAATNAAPLPALATTTEPVAAEPVIEETVVGPALRTGRLTPQIVEELRPQTAATAASRSVSARRAIYVVQSGDTVEKIAKRHGTTIEAIKAANKLKSHLIYPGQKLLVKPTPAGATAEVRKAKSSNEV